jgi:hypothetical protein
MCVISLILSGQKYKQLSRLHLILVHCAEAAFAKLKNIHFLVVIKLMQN